MDKTLYLSEGSSNLVVKRDGPSIWITRDNKAGQRIPARLVSRVVIIGNVMLDAGALTLFSENDIPVVLMNRSAEELAVTMPCSHRLPLHYRTQKTVFEKDAYISRYEEWAFNWHLSIEIRVLRRLYPQFKGLLPFRIHDKDYAEVLSYLRPRDEEKSDIVRRFVNNLFRGLIIEQLLRNELDPHLGVIHKHYAFGLVLDICHLLAAEQDMQCLQFFRCSAIEKPALDKNYRVRNVTDSVIQSIVHRFENRRAEISKLTGNIVSELIHFMGQLPK